MMSTAGVDLMDGAFALRLRQLRPRRGVDRKAVSECCGLSKNTVARYERGERIPSIRQAVVLAEYYHVTLDYLCGRE